jgi:LacI family transcriptional regulator
MGRIREPSAGARRPTMRDVAARAEVSFKTVSRVVNDEGGVSPLLEQRVRRAIEELDFRPNVGARILRRADRRTASIGLLLEDVANPFSAAVQRAVEDVAVPRGVVVYSASLDEDPARERALAKVFAARGVDGLLLAPAGDDQSHLEAERRAGTAVVCVDREAGNLPVDSVITTNAIGAAQGVRHLGAAGHRRIAFLGDRRTIVTAQQRYEGYRDALRELGIPLDPALVVHDVRDPGDADGAVTALLARSDPATALFTAQNMVTIGAVRALRRLGLEHAVAVVGFDDFLLADLLSPAVTVVAQDPAAIGRIAAGLLFDRIAGDASPPQVRLVPTTLVRRGSGEIRPAGDPARRGQLRHTD